MRRTPALIVGAGPAGATAALVLARAGAAHLLVERTAAPGDALCGGFLSWRTLAALERLGIERDALSRHPVRRVRLFAAHRTAESHLPQTSLAVSRQRLDTVLLAAAHRAGAAIEQGVGVRAVEGQTARTDDGALLDADALFLASGKHDLRGLGRPAAARGADPTLGLRVRIADAPGLRRLVGDAVELHLFDRGYAGIAVQEDGSVNLCLAVHRSRLAAAGSPAALLAELGAASPRLGERLGHGGGEPIDAVANVPYGWRAGAGRAGLFRLGDQAAVIPSLAGEGIGIAVASGRLAAERYLAGGAAAGPGYRNESDRRLGRPFAVAGTIRKMAEQPVGAAVLLTVARLAPALVAAAARLTRIVDLRPQTTGTMPLPR